jgi:hypothetical protein
MTTEQAWASPLVGLPTLTKVLCTFMLLVTPAITHTGGSPPGLAGAPRRLRFLPPALRLHLAAPDFHKANCSKCSDLEAPAPSTSCSLPVDVLTSALRANSTQSYERR